MKNLIIVFVFIILGTVQVFGETTFKLKNSDGIEITYVVINATDVSVKKAKLKRKNKRLVIPDKVTYLNNEYIVSEIATDAFSHRWRMVSYLRIEEVYLPSTLKKISSWAFHGCSDLRHIEFPEGLIEIGSYAFFATYELKNLKLPSSLKVIGDKAFSENNFLPVKECTIENLPNWINEYNCERLGLSRSSVQRFYAYHPEAIPKMQQSVETHVSIGSSNNANTGVITNSTNSNTQVDLAMKRINEMFGNLTTWSMTFESQTGRKPTQFEESEWVRQNYPDMYETYIRTLSQRGNVQANSSKSKESRTSSGSLQSERNDSNPTGKKVKCNFCNNGRVLYEKDASIFGIDANVKYHCNECGATYPKGYVHSHSDCNHCKGKGYTYR